MKKLLFSLFLIPTLVTNLHAYDSVPLERTFSLGVKAGVAPTYWFVEKNPNKLLDGIETMAKNLGMKTHANFDDIFETPVWIAGELGFALTGCIQLFGEGTWRYAETKKNLGIDTTKTETYGAYAGIRYYPTSLNNWFIHPYCGIKIGNMWQYVTSTDTTSKKFISGGVMLGFTASPLSCMKMTFGTEVLVSGPALTAENFGRKATEVTIPITLGLEIAY